MRVPAAFRAGIARLGPDEGAELREFQLRTFGPETRQVDRLRSEWLFDRNPRSSAAGRDVWVCRRDGAIVGQQAEIPFLLRVGDRDVAASWAIDLMVDDAWRLRGVGPGLFAELLDRRPLVAAMNMSDQGFLLMERAGCRDLGVVPVYLRPLRLGAAARLAGASPRRQRLLGPASPGLRVADGMAAAGIRGLGLRLEPVARFDERLDEVWSRSEGDYPVLARRDHPTVAWQIDERPDRDIMQRFYLVRGARTLGYVVLRPAGTVDEPTAVVVDYLAPARWVAPLLLAAAGAARRQGAVALSVKTRNLPADRALRAAGFLRRLRGADEPVRFMVSCRDERGGLCDLVGRPESWFVTSADCDLEYARAPSPDPDHNP